MSSRIPASNVAKVVLSRAKTMDDPRFQCLDCDKIFHVEIAGSAATPEVICCPLCNSSRVEQLPESASFFLEEGEHAGWAGSIN